MGIRGCIRVAVLELLLSLFLTGLTDAVPESRETTADVLPPLCAQPALSLSPPSSVHAVRPSDVTVVSALGLPHSHRSATARVLNRLSELLSMYNPDVTSLLPDQTTTVSQQRSVLEQAEDLVLSLSSNQVVDAERDWKLLLLFVPVDELCFCPGQAKEEVAAAAGRVEEVLHTLHGKLHRTLVHVVVWSGQTDDGSPQHGRMCQCEEKYNKGRHRLERAILTSALQESLGGLLEQCQWFSEREDFSALLQPSPADTDSAPHSAVRHPLIGQTSQLMDQLAIQLWTNLLQPKREEPEEEDSDIISIPCPTEERPFLRTWQNSLSKAQHREKSQSGERESQPTPLFDPVMGSELPCEDRSPSPTPPTSVHALRPADIKVVAALGDSLTAANGAGTRNQNNILDVLRQYRGLSWSIGGDNNLTNVTTFPNILREFNPLLTGFSEGLGDENSPLAFLNQAVPGANSHDMPIQAQALIDRMKNDSRIDFQNDWKVITMFIGGNDLCDYCTDLAYFSAANVVYRIKEALDLLRREVPRALVNLVEVMHIVPLRALHQHPSIGCPTFLVELLCPCVVKPTEGSVELQSLTDLNRAYQRGMRELVDSGLYGTNSSFTVVLQPFFREVVVPLLEDGRPDRSYFAPDCFHLSQKAHTLMARALWNNMLEPVGNKTYTQDFTSGISLQCPSKTSPFLRTYENSNYTYNGPPPTPPPMTNWGSDFSCVDIAPSNSVPTSVHRLRPADINVVASLGDSITAGFGAKAKNLLQLRNEERGVSWSIGGDETLETVTTIPNILKKFNQNVFGFSKGRSKRPNGFNMAVSGAKAHGIPGQVRDLIQAMRNSTSVDFERDWKLVTVFIGGNDLCQYCNDRATLSPKNYSLHLMESLDMLYKEVPRVLINLVEILEIEDLRKIKSSTLGCTILQENLCPCFLIPGENTLELSEMKRINRELQDETQRLVSGGRYDGREDFAAVVQPFFQNSIVPMGTDGNPDVSFFSVDCFHFSERGHAEMAISLWNNMLEPVGSKQNFNNFTHDRSKIQCPTTDHPFIFTQVNSAPPVPTVPLTNQDSVPGWAAAVLAVTGLLIGWAVTWFFFSYKERRNRKRMSAMVEMKGTEF